MVSTRVRSGFTDLLALLASLRRVRRVVAIPRPRPTWPLQHADFLFAVGILWRNVVNANARGYAL